MLGGTGVLEGASDRAMTGGQADSRTDARGGGLLGGAYWTWAA